MSRFDALIESVDPDRRMAAMFAPAEIRERLLTLYAFYHEIAKVPDTVSEAVIGEMRLAWAREAVNDLFATPQKVRRHDIYEALNHLISVPGAPDHAALDGLIEARAADLGEGPFPSADERERYVDATSGALMRMATRLAAPDWTPTDQADAALTAAGRLWGYTGLIRAFANLTQAGRPPLTADELKAAGLSELDLSRGRNTAQAREGLKGLVAAAQSAARALNRTRSALPASVFPAVGYARLARSYLKASSSLSDPYRQGVELSLWTRQSQLTWASLSGRV